MRGCGLDLRLSRHGLAARPFEHGAIFGFKKSSGCWQAEELLPPQVGLRSMELRS
jgi:hypothetical protein